MRYNPRLHVLLLLALGLAPAALSAQEGVRLGLMYQPEYQPGLVVLPFAGEGAASRAALPIERIIRQDLDFSNRFEMLSAAAATSPGGTVNLQLWKERGADWVVQGTLTPGPAGGALIRLVLHDAVYGQVKGDQTFVVPAEGDPNFRMAVHSAADEIVRWATGDPGMAATRISFVLEARGSKELYVIDYDGENVQRLTSDGTITLSPAWSPDGNLLAYTSYRSGSPLLYERDMRTGRDRLISDRDGINITPTYDPTGQVLAFATTVAGNTEIATYNRTRNCCLEQHTRGRQFDSLSPSYSADGRQIAFMSNRLGEPHIYVMAVGGGEPRLISDYAFGGRGYNSSPDWSPRGQRIAYHSRIGNLMQIMVADLDRGTRRLLTNEGNNEDPSWAPDGRHVVFSSRDREGGGLFILDTVSGTIRPLLRGTGYGLPAWSPALYRAQIFTAR
jgi:TolB protein